MRKERHDRGFTLAELLIVVAIIGVLVAISIPIFSSQLEKAREATDAANIRSQYAEVLTDAILSDGSVNKNHATYAPIQLRQQKDEWQDAGLKTNLEGVYGKVVGDYPKAGGQAWVEYDASADVSILHYEDGNGTSGGSGSESGGGETPAPTNPTPTPTEPSTPAPTKPDPTEPSAPEPTKPDPTEPSTPEPTEPETPSGGSVINKVESSAGTWPTPGSTGSVEIGKSYKLPDGTTYIATSEQHYNQYYTAHYPTEDGYGWLGVKPSGTIITSDKAANGKLTVTVNCGDIFENPDGNFYIWKNSSSNSWGAPIDDQNWVKLIIE